MNAAFGSHFFCVFYHASVCKCNKTDILSFIWACAFFCFVVSYLIYSYLFVNRFLRLKKIEMKNLVIQSIIHTFV